MPPVRARPSWLCALALLCAAPALCAPALPPAVASRLASSGLPLSSFGVHVQPVDAGSAAALASLNAERPFVLASTAKLVTSLAALDLLAPAHRSAAAGVAPPAPARTVDAGAFLRGRLVVSVQPAPGAKAAVTLQPHPGGVRVVNEVYMDGACGAWAQWREDRPGELWVRGRWNEACGRQDIARMRAPGSSLQRVRHAAAAAIAAPAKALTALGQLPAILRTMNKSSDNAVARTLLLQLAPPQPQPRRGALGAARERVHRWLRTQGLREGDIRIDIGSGQSRLERGKPRAMVELLRRAWRDDDARAFVDSLPIAGVDGTLANRLRGGPAEGRAWLKTGTLRDTRALAGYVRGKSGRVYAVAAIVNHPNAARATPTLDALVEWVAANG